MRQSEGFLFNRICGKCAPAFYNAKKAFVCGFIILKACWFGDPMGSCFFWLVGVLVCWCVGYLVAGVPLKGHEKMKRAISIVLG